MEIMFAGGWAWADIHNPKIMTVIKLEENVSLAKLGMIISEDNQDLHSYKKLRV